jgi:hypothetical protein
VPWIAGPAAGYRLSLAPLPASLAIRQCDELDCGTGLFTRRIDRINSRQERRRRRRRVSGGGRAGRGSPRGSRRGGSTAARGGWWGPRWRSRRRPREDPHLLARTSCDELEDRGYPLSYPTLTRQIRARNLRPPCRDCAHAADRANAVIDHPPGEETHRCRPFCGTSRGRYSCWRDLSVEIRIRLRGDGAGKEAAVDNRCAGRVVALPST